MKVNYTPKSLALGLGLLLCQGCLVTKRYQEPEVTVAEQYQSINLSDSTSIAELSWNQFFTDEKLRTLLEEALTSNIDLLMATQRVEAAEAYYKQGRAGYLPTLTAGVSASNTSTSEANIQGLDLNYDSYSMYGELGWELDLWGKIKSNKRATQALYLQNKESLKAVQTQVVASLASSYYQLLATDAQVALMQKTVDNREESYETMIALKEAGLVNQSAVLSAKAQWLNTQSMLKDVEQQQTLLENTINLLLGRNSKEIARAKLEEVNITNELPTGYPVLLLHNRPDVQAAEYALQHSFENTNIARANFYPSLTISATAGTESMEISDWFSPEAFFSQIVGGLTQPILNRKSIKTQYEVSKAKQEEALLQLQKSVLVATKEVSETLLQIKTEREKVEIQSEQLEALSKTISYTEDLLKSGYSTYLEVLTARSSTLSAEIALISSQYKEVAGKVKLYQALGGGWK